MSTGTELVTIEAPGYLAAYAAQHGSKLAAINEAAMGGLSAGMPPTIGLNGTRFVVKEGGEDKTLNQLELQGVILKAKPGIDKQWYAVKFVPGQEPTSPDCYSLNGITPEPDSTSPQCANCAGCAHNQFGSATDNAGNAMKGKACADNKIVAMWANSGIYRFKIPAASLKNFVAYVKQLGSHNLFLPAVITTIGFDPTATYPLLTFKAAGALTEAQFATIVAKIDSPEVDEALMVKAPQQQIAAPVQTPAPAVTSVNIDAGLGFSTEPTAPVVDPQAAAKAATAAKAAATKAANKAAADKLAADNAAAAATNINVVEDATLVDPLAGIGSAPAAGPTAEELSAALGL
jgi:hypothetical protein